MSIYRFGKLVMAVGISALLAGCEKNALSSSEFQYITPQEAQVKVIFTSSYQANPGFHIKINDARVSGVLNFTSGNPTPFPGGGLQTGGGSTSDYLIVPARENKITIARPFVGTANDSVLLATSTNTFEAGKKYSLYFTDTAAKTTSLLVVDSLTAPDSGFVRYKFINLMPDLPGVDLYLGTLKVAENIPFKGVSPAFTIPTNNASTTWAIRSAGSATNLHTYASAASVATSNQRVMTVIARGYSTISAAADTRKRAVSLIYNQ
ncbi:DUF4397 domain-containing protein [Terrimonas sp. NA20]|uniref:DUF4397 domain-containing protein n=1 Tax=Terrimonas ginsenosidimutans TaxID=2908004 RepID=A0ABS9KW28_9BACT|nr:DUF4397 domain-containing protein [Terrimonas ginsenosidimutans]MCG2616567.1 DUF4397 domain-containing protein [Terrimonas ginsenosidimutans]